MRRLSQIILLLAFWANIYSQSPHGDKLTISCDDCHNAKGWTLEAGTYSFTHNKTGFPLEGMHQDVNCKSCHPTLIFSEADNDCMSCHTDMHQQSVGLDCVRCHTPKSWIVENITEIHQQSRFPLVGAHFTADCYDCHPSASLLQFQPLGIECYDCHMLDYASTASPNHIDCNFSTECNDCHSIDAFSWTGSGFNHAFFPLIAGHAIGDCNQCHTGTDCANISADCYSCHQSDYSSTTNPGHMAADINTNCSECHSTNPGWKPAEFTQHDAQFFPIYSGKHGNEWNSCTDCHLNPANYASFTCIDCHEHNQPDMDDEHNEIGGYAYNSIACLECHPTGDAEEGFNHSATNFPLTGAHVDTDCKDCHPQFYIGTTMVCYDCHTEAYNASSNPNHIEAGIQNACEECHTTQPGWIPASFSNHDEVYALTGAHSSPEVDCFACHQGNYSNTPNECAGCHTTNYNETTNPNHIEAGISFLCDDCHTTDPGWTPAAFDIHNEYYPLTGAHISMATCFDCHEGNYTNTPNECAGCHMTNYDETTNPNHNQIGLLTTCEDCHTTNPGWAPAGFPNHNDFYVLQGAHIAIANDCFVCHEGNYNNTPNTCYGCHATEYIQTNDPNHAAAQFPTTCEDCHTQSAWEPSTFNHDGQYFPIYSGSHQGEWDQCIDCHENPSNYAIFTCLTCHEQGEMADEHQGISGYQYNSPACLACHPDGTSSGAFNHSGTNFPLTGAHTTIDCSACHENGYSGTSTNCADCHGDDYNQTTNPNHNGLGISNDCEECHTTNPTWKPATFAIHNDFYVLQGAHVSIGTDCFACHQGNYNSTPNTCFGCHASDYNQTNDPPHASAQFPTTCEDCHTQSAWEPSTFNHDGQYFPIYSGEHNGEWDQCSDCHNNPGNYAIFTCLTCHEEGDMQDDHSEVTGYVYNSIACLNCHPNGNSDSRIFKKF